MGLKRWVVLTALKRAIGAEMFAKVLAFLNGKKTILGLILVALPALFTALQTFLTQVGLAGGVKYIGIALTIAGLAHKFLKALDIIA